MSLCGGRARRRTTRRDECDGPAGDTAEHLVVAPHEFFGLGHGRRLATPAFRDFRRSCTLFLAEQMGSKHYALCLPFVAEAKRVLDLDPRSAEFLVGLGANAQFFPIGYVANHSHFGRDVEACDDDFDARPIDVLFHGVLTRRRSEFFAEHASFFASRRCELVMPTLLSPLSSALASVLTTQQAVAASRRAKIVLNLHRSESQYFEWHRIVVRGLWHRCLVVSEPCDPVPGLRPGLHYLEAPLGEIPGLLRSLLESSEGRVEAQRVRSAGHQALRERFDGVEWAGRLADWQAGRPGSVRRS